MTKLSKYAGGMSIVDFGADPTGVLNSGPSIQAAANAAGAEGVGLLTPHGRFRIASEVIVDATDSPSDRAFTLSGARGGSRFIVDIPGAKALRFPNWLSVDIRDLTFYGVAGRLYDCTEALDFASSSGVHVRDCTFKGIASSGYGVIHNGAGDLAMTDVQLAGCTADEAVVCSRDNWRRHEMLRVTMNDIGILDHDAAISKVGTNANQLIPRAWVRSEDVAVALGAFRQSVFSMERCWLDENAARAIQVLSTTNRLFAVDIINCPISTGVTDTDSAATIEIGNVERAFIRNTYTKQLNGTPNFQRDALALMNVLRTELNGFQCHTEATAANRITTDADCAALVMHGMVQGRDYRTLDADLLTVVTSLP